MHFISVKKTEGSLNCDELNKYTYLNQTQEEDLFLMANLRQKTTGLPMVIWVSEKGNAKHHARIKVSLTHSDKINIEETVSVSLIEPFDIVAGNGLNNKDLECVKRFIQLNQDVLLQYWNNEIDTADLLADLKKLAIEN